MNFSIDFNCDNAAFDGPDCIDEIKRVVNSALTILESGKLTYNNKSVKLKDINGNTIGIVQFY